MVDYTGVRVQIREVSIFRPSGAAYSQGRTFTQKFQGIITEQKNGKFYVKGLGGLNGRYFKSTTKNDNKLQYHLYHVDGKKETYLAPLTSI